MAYYLNALAFAGGMTVLHHWHRQPSIHCDSSILSQRGGGGVCAGCQYGGWLQSQACRSEGHAHAVDGQIVMCDHVQIVLLKCELSHYVFAPSMVSPYRALSFSCTISKHSVSHISLSFTELEDIKLEELCVFS